MHNETDFGPFNFNVEGQPQGYSIDYMNLVAAKVGLQPEYISGPTWQEFLSMMRSGDLEVMLNIASTPDRLEYMRFTDQYLQMPSAIVVRDPDLQVQSLQDLYGKRVSVPEGFNIAEVLARDHPEIELVLEDDTLGSLYAVLEGRADAMLDDLPVVDFLIDASALGGLRYALITRDPQLSQAQTLARFDHENSLC